MRNTLALACKKLRNWFDCVSSSQIKKELKYMIENNASEGLIDLAADIVVAYVSKNTVSPSELPHLIREVYGALEKVVNEPSDASSEPLRPAVSVRRSITPDYLICLEDGQKFKSLKRHLRTHYDLSPEQYRDKWSLPSDYPMVAPNYALARSDLAKKMGLGQKGGMAS